MTQSEATDDASVDANGGASDRDWLSRIRALWQRTQKPNAAALLAENVQLRKNRALVLDLAYEEYCIRRECGETVDIQAFCQGFPSISRSLYRQLEVDEYLRKNPELLSPQAAIQWPRRGDRLFGFLVVEEIGRGAFARAYLCAQPGIGNRQVVVKVAQGGAVEADTMGTLDHPNIMPIYSVQEDETTGLTGICMPFVGRSTLHDVIDVAYCQKGLPGSSAVILDASRGLCRRTDRYHPLIPRMRVRRGSPYVTGVLQLGWQLADALWHAHQRTVFHGDLKPSNIVMSVEGIPVIVDFNLAQGHGSQNLITGGTLPYMAPEQIRAVLMDKDENDTVDHRADIFSLGAILFELLFGHIPFPVDRETEREPAALAGWLLDVQSQGMPIVSAGRAGIDPRIIQWVARCLAYDPTERPADMMEVLDELSRFLSPTRRLARSVRQNRRWALAGLATCGLSAVGLGAVAALRPPARDRYFQRGLQQYAAEDFTDAIESFRLTLSEDPEFAPAFIGRACASLRQYDLDSYRGWLSSSSRDLFTASQFAKSEDIDKLTAYCLIRNDQFTAAESFLANCFAQNDTADPGMHVNFAFCRLKRPPEAMASMKAIEDAQKDVVFHLKEAIRVSPLMWQAHLGLAINELNRFYASNRAYVPRQGVESIRVVLRQLPDEAMAHYYGAKLFGIVGILDDDKQLYEDAIRSTKRATELGHVFSLTYIRDEFPFNQLVRDPRVVEVLRSQPRDRTAKALDRVVVPEILFELETRIKFLKAKNARV